MNLTFTLPFLVAIMCSGVTPNTKCRKEIRSCADKLIKEFVKTREQERTLRLKECLGALKGIRGSLTTADFESCSVRIYNGDTYSDAEFVAKCGEKFGGGL